MNDFQTNTGELDKLITLIHRIRVPGKTVRTTLEQLVYVIRDDFGYESAELYCKHKYTKIIERTVASSNNLPLHDIQSIRSIMFSGQVRKESGKDGHTTLYLPVPLPESGGETENSGSPAVKNDLYTHWGVLITVSKSNPSDHSIQILKLIAAEITNIVQMHETRQHEKRVLNCLNETRRINSGISDISDVSQLFAVWSNSTIVRKMFDGMALWLSANGKDLVDIYHGTPDFAQLNPERFLSKTTDDKYQELYKIGIADCHSMILQPLFDNKNFIGSIGFFKSYKRLVRPEERDTARMVSEQFFLGLQNILLRSNLEEQRQQLVYEKEFSNKIFVSIKSGIIVVADTGKVLTANPYALEKLGFSMEELTSGTLETLVPGLLSNATEMRGEGVFVLSNQREVHLGFSMSQLHYSDDQTGKIILFRDISEIVGMRNELGRKEYFSTIGKMASWIAHEVRNPVFVISSIAKILSKQGKEPDQEKFISSILKETKSLNTLVEDLLIYGKPLELNMEKVLISDYISEIAAEMKSLSDEAGAEIVVTPANDVLLAEIDRKMIKQVLCSLIKNSFEAGATIVNITTTPDVKMIKLSVIDNGKGIKPMNIDKMFFPFISTKKSGTGLGLSICKKIVEDHGGNIQISSEPEMGVHVQIELKKVQG